MKSNWDHWDDLDTDSEDSYEKAQKEKEQKEEEERLERKRKWEEEEAKKPKFYRGDKVRVKEEFTSNAHEKCTFTVDQTLYVIGKDGEGDILVNDGTMEKNTWILRKNWDKIEYIACEELSVGNVVEVVNEVKTASKNPIILRPGDRFVVQRMDRAGDFTINNGKMPKNQWLLRRHLYDLKKVENPYKVGDLLQITEPFKASSANPQQLTKGMIVTIKKIDEAGDFSVGMAAWSKNQWITKKNFNKIIKFDAGDLIDVENLDDDFVEVENLDDDNFLKENNQKKPAATVQNESTASKKEENVKSSSSPGVIGSGKNQKQQKTYGSVRDLPENASLGGVRRIGDAPIVNTTTKKTNKESTKKAVAKTVAGEKAKEEVVTKNSGEESVTENI